MTANRLAGAASPYLRQHADNPVHWQPWDDDAFALARRVDKPILLSIGYSACHWCHVMARECFEDPDIAGQMNDLFVPVKVDREERPDLDRLFLGALAGLGSQAGWPLTAFLTPDGTPYSGGGYFPPRPTFGLPGFPEVLSAAAALYRRDPDAAGQRGAQAIAAAVGVRRETTSGTISTVLLDRVAHELARSIDWLYGGFGINPPKFLHAGGHEILLRAWVRTGEPGLRDAALSSMRQICDGAVYDHVGGGFHRYAADDRWQVPHFEKMLCDNAVMLALLVKLFQASGEPVFAERAGHTVAWLLREMRLPDGSFAASLAADTDAGDHLGGKAGGEGAFYTWAPGETAAVLGDDHAAFAAAYDEASDGPFGGRAVLYRRPNTPDTPLLLERLRDYREQRDRPARDDKLLADWNGLAVAALAEAGLVLERPDWVAAAQTAFNAALAQLGGPQALRHSDFEGLPGPAGFLDDYANLAAAALALHEATGQAAPVDTADALVKQLDAHFWDQAGGYAFADAPATAGLPRACLIDETTAPSGNGTMLCVLARLAALTGEQRHLHRAEDILRRFADRMSRASLAAATALNNSLAPQHLVQITIIGNPADQATHALVRTVTARLVPDRLLLQIPSDTASQPAVGKTMLAGKPSAYVCVGTVCLAPVTRPGELAACLDGVVGEEGRPKASPLDTTKA